ncbi:MAG: gp53-like domain-containing protein [Paraclostridium sp.]
MATWRTPKKNWLPSDGVANTDLNRIEENEEYLYDKTLKESTSGIEFSVSGDKVTKFVVGTTSSGSSPTDMMKSLVPMYDVEGKTQDGYYNLESVILKEIAVIAKNDASGINVLNVSEKQAKNATVSYNGSTSVKVTTTTNNFGYVEYGVSVTSGGTYALSFDYELESSNKGRAWATVSKTYNNADTINVIRDFNTLHGNSKGGLFTVPKDTTKISIKLSPNVQLPSGNRTVIYKNVYLHKVKSFQMSDVELNGFPSTKTVDNDLLTDKYLIQKSKRVRLSEIISVENISGPHNTLNNTVVYYIGMPGDCISVDKDGVNMQCSNFKVGTHDDVYGNKNNAVFALRLKQQQLSFRVSNSFSTAQSIYDYITEQVPDMEIIYPLSPSKWIYKPNDLMVNADKDDTIMLFTPAKPSSVKHKIQKSEDDRIGAISKLLVKTQSKLISLIQPLLNSERYISSNGYIKLPKALGGIMLQWGTHTMRVDAAGESIGLLFNYPIKFPHGVYYVGTNCKSHSAILSSASEIDTSKFRSNIRWGAGGDLWVGPYTVCWFAIGR